MSSDDRLEREREFHDSRFSAEENRAASGFYAITGASSDRYDALVDSVEAGRHVLELGCGDQAAAWRLLERGVEVTAIDISPVAIDHARTRARVEGLTGGTFLEMNAEQLQLDSASVDVVIGSGILHHLDVGRALDEITRVLVPGGRLIMVEPLGHNPVLNLYRRATPSQRTADEHPLRTTDLDEVRSRFDEVDVQPFHLLSLASLALLRWDQFDAALHRLDRADRALFRSVPAAGRLAWMVVVDASNPRAA